MRIPIRIASLALALTLAGCGPPGGTNTENFGGPAGSAPPDAPQTAEEYEAKNKMIPAPKK